MISADSKSPLRGKFCHRRSVKGQNCAGRVRDLMQYIFFNKNFITTSRFKFVVNEIDKLSKTWKDDEVDEVDPSTWFTKVNDYHQKTRNALLVCRMRVR